MVLCDCVCGKFCLICSFDVNLDGSAVKYEEYLNQCKLDNTPMMTSVMQFHETFYSRLFDVHPVSCLAFSCVL